jgi:P27 family predicted phage terminase small subunit
MMSKRGRKPKPRHLRQLHGNPSKLPPALDEPEGVGILRAPPDWFDDEQRLQWHYAIENAPPGLLTDTDREVLIVWTVACIEHAKATQEVRKLGQVVKTKEGSAIQNPFLPIVNRQALIMMRAGAEMGFSPSSRASIGRGEPLPGAGRAGQIAGTPLAAYLAEKPDKLDDE